MTGGGNTECGAHEGGGAFVGRLGREDDTEVGDGVGTSPVGDQKFGEVQAQRRVPRSLGDDGREGVNEGIRHAPKPTGRLPHLRPECGGGLPYPMPIMMHMRKKPTMAATYIEVTALEKNSGNRLHRRMKDSRTPRGKVRLNVEIWTAT